MTWRDLRLRARALLAPRRVERELDDELAFHLEMETRKHVEAGDGARRLRDIRVGGARARATMAIARAHVNRRMS